MFGKVILEEALKFLIGAGYNAGISGIKNLHAKIRKKDTTTEKELDESYLDNGEDTQSYEVVYEDGLLFPKNLNITDSVADQKRFEYDMLKAVTKAQTSLLPQNEDDIQAENTALSVVVKFPGERAFVLPSLSSRNNFKELDILFGGFCPSAAVPSSNDIPKKKKLTYFWVAEKGKPLVNDTTQYVHFRAFNSLKEAEEYRNSFDSTVYDSKITNSVEEINTWIRHVNDERALYDWQTRIPLYSGTAKDLADNQEKEDFAILYDAAESRDAEVNFILKDGTEIRGPVVFANAVVRNDENIPICLSSLDEKQIEKILNFCEEYSSVATLENESKTPYYKLDKEFSRLCNDNLLARADSLIKVSPASYWDIYQSVGEVETCKDKRFFLCEYGGAAKEVAPNERVLLSLEHNHDREEIALELFGPSVTSRTREVLCISAVRAYAKAWGLPISRDSAFLMAEQTKEDLQRPNREAFEELLAETKPKKKAVERV